MKESNRTGEQGGDSGAEGKRRAGRGARRALAALPRVAVVAGQALWQAYARAILSAGSRGVRLPGEARARASLGAQTLSAYERKTLVYELKASRYQWSHGPLWLRAAVDATAVTWRSNRFWLVLLAKFASGVLALSFPVALFLLLRGVLPVPSRVPERAVASPLPPRTSLGADAPWTAAGDSWGAFASARDPQGRLRGVTVERLGPGRVLFALGGLPRRREAFAGHLASEDAPLVLTSDARIRVAVEGRNRLRVPFFAFPSDGREASQCRLELRDGTGSLLVAADFTPPRRPGALASRLAALFQSRFTPDFALETVEARELFVDTDDMPRRIEARAFRSPGNGSAGTPASSAGAPESGDGATPPAAHACLVGLGVPTFEWQRVAPFPRRGLVVVSVEGMRAADARDALNAPFLASLARAQAADFRQHRVSSNEPDANTAALLGASVPEAFVGALDEDSLLPSRLRALGYQTAAFGRLGFAGGTPPRGLGGFGTVVSLEAREYEARHVTEEAAAWIGRAGETPFFAFAQYSTLLPPFRPPSSHLPVSALGALPFALAREAAFREALLRYADREIAALAGRLRDLGVWEGLDFIVTSNGALPLEPREFPGVADVPAGARASLRLRESGLLDAELRVPLVWKPSGAGADSGWAVERPTFQEDVALTLARLHGARPAAREPDPDARGMDFSEILSREGLLDLNSALDERHLFPLWGTAEIGVLAFDAHGRGAAKFVDQLVPRATEFLLPGAPFERAGTIPPGERVYRVEGGGLGAERAVPAPGSGTLSALRALLRRAHFAGRVPLRFEATRHARVRLSFLLTSRAGAGVREAPPGVVAVWDALDEGSWRMTIEGRLRPGEAIRVNVPEGGLSGLDIAEGVEGVVGSGAEGGVGSNTPGWRPSTASICLGALRLNAESLVRVVRSFHPCLYQPETLGGALGALAPYGSGAPDGRREPSAPTAPRNGEAPSPDPGTGTRPAPAIERNAADETPVFALSLERAPSLAKAPDGR